MWIIHLLFIILDSFHIIKTRLSFKTLNLIFSSILTTRDAANKMHVMMGTWFGIKRYILCKRIFNRAYLTCLIMYEYVWHKWNKVKLKKDLPTLTSTWSVDAKILHIYLLLTRCSEKLFDLSFLFLCSYHRCIFELQRHNDGTYRKKKYHCLMQKKIWFEHHVLGGYLVRSYERIWVLAGKLC